MLFWFVFLNIHLLFCPGKNIPVLTVKLSRIWRNLRDKHLFLHDPKVITLAAGTTLLDMGYAVLPKGCFSPSPPP